MTGRSPASVVVATRDRPGLLTGCLTALRHALGPDDELVVVDSASVDASATASVAGAARARLIRLEQPGTCRARNAGWRMARHPLVLFTDDDCRPASDWVAQMVAAFDREAECAFVTGAVHPDPGAAGRAQLHLSLLTDTAPRVFSPTTSSATQPTVEDLIVGPRPEPGPSDAPWSGDPPWSDDPRRSSPSDPPWSGDGTATGCDDRCAAGPGADAATAIGHGANMAWRTSALDAIGGFDEAMGPGTPLRGAEDHDAFWRAGRMGLTGRYEPASVVVHHQWRTRRAQLQAYFGYGVGTGATLAKQTRLAAGRAGPPLRPATVSRLAAAVLWRDGWCAVVTNVRARFEMAALGEATKAAGEVLGVLRSRALPLDDRARFVVEHAPAPTETTRRSRRPA
jgi:GT2 family glycosyltransferase